MRLFKICMLLKLSVISFYCNSQTINADFHDRNIVFTSGTSNVNFDADFGIDSNDFLNGLHGITFNIGFDPAVIYPDSLTIRANSDLLGIERSEYMEMQRIDSSFVLYSIVLKGREKTLDMSSLPLMFNFKINPDISQKLVENDCNYQIYFSVENHKAQDSNQSVLEVEPFDLAIDIDCEAIKKSRTLTVSPNPTKGKTWVNLPSDFVDSIDQIRVCDMKGILIPAKIREYDNIIEVDLSPFKPGLYLITLTYEKWEKDVLKVIKI